MALVYFVMCHHSPGAVADLLRHVWRPEHHYLMHADRKSAPAVHATLARLAAALPNVRVLPSVLCSWGGWSLVETTLRAIDHACALPAAWSHLILLSESHLPLVPPEAAAAALRPGVSYIEAAPVAKLNRDARSDVLHRFAARYHEVPGVGSFAAAPQALSPAFVATLHQGTQWIVLARDACERLRARLADAALWQPFRASLLPDETALQSVLLGTEVGTGLAIERRATTYVALSRDNGVPDTNFTAQDFHVRARGHLFIRKRPDVLPGSVAQALAPMSMLQTLPAPAEGDDAFTGGETISALATVLRHALQAGFPGAEVSAVLPTRAGTSVTCYLRFASPDLPEALTVALLSEDMTRFKVLLAWRHVFDNTFRTGTLGGYPTSLLKVRAWELFQTREVLVPELAGAGFVAMRQGSPIERLLHPIGALLAAGARLAPSLAG